MRITIEIDHKSELEKLKMLLKTFKINTVTIAHESDGPGSKSIRKGDKKIDPTTLFGIWSDSPRSPEKIRKDAWSRKPPLK